MPPTTYQGSLQSKNKTDLKAIATALRLNTDGTKDDIQGRIKRHLDAHQSKLEDNPTFSGLYVRTRRKGSERGSEKPPSQVIERQPTLATSRLAPERDRDSSPPAKPLRNKHLAAVVSMDPIPETPVKDLRVVSAMLKNADPLTPYASPDHHQQLVATPSSLPPLPPSVGTQQSISAMVLSRPRELVRKMMHTEMTTAPPNQSIKAVRGFLSNSRNLWSLTALLEMCYILAVITHWEPYDVSPNFKVAYPSGVDSWWILLHWAIPSLLVPSIVGTLISFSPASEPDHVEFDPLTASIVRLAAEAVYPYERFQLKSTSASSLTGYTDADVLGLRWRVVAAGLGVAFAFAEAITGAPKAIAREMREAPRSATPLPSGRKMIVAQQQEDEDEGDQDQDDDDEEEDGERSDEVD